MSVPQAPSSTRIRSLASRLISLGRVPLAIVSEGSGGRAGTLSRGEPSRARVPRRRLPPRRLSAATATAATGPSGAFFVLTLPLQPQRAGRPDRLPGQPAHSHDHVFIGNASTNAFSTPASLAGPPRDDLQRHGRPLGLLGADALRRRQRGAAARRDDLLPAADDGAGAAVPDRARDGRGQLARGHAAERRVTQWYCGVLKSSFYGPHAPHRAASRRPGAPELPGARRTSSSRSTSRTARTARRRAPTTRATWRTRAPAAARRRTRSRCRRSR